MGVIETGAIFNGFTFDGKNSKDYGVYITGEAVFNSPERDVEMISIPGRNGEYARDTGRFMNIEVTYPAGLFGVDPADFADAISDFRNMLGSRVGYCRLEDDYNPGEYRMGVFKAGLEVEPANLEAGEFTITFNCKPQRFLTTGETAVSMTSGDTITNPTLFESRPMLQVWGYGDIDIDGQELSIFDTTIGLTRVMDGKTVDGLSATGTLIDEYANPGDTITYAEGYGYYVSLFLNVKTAGESIDSITPFPGGIGISRHAFRKATDRWQLNVVLGGSALSYGTIGGPLDLSRFTVTYSDSTTKTITYDSSYQYNGATTITASMTGISLPTGWTVESGKIMLQPLDLDSTQTAVGSPIYFDLDIGEAYKIENDVPVSVNNAVTIPAVLPTLKPGSNTITYDNTITQFKVVPRWWKV